MAKQKLVTLTTDFGTADPYAAAMKGVLLSRCPQARVVDISHDVPPQDVLAGAMVLAQAAPHFPPDTVHVVVVDPGVGTQRRILAACFGKQTFLFPDNGVITLLAERLPLAQIVAVRNAQYLPPAQPSRTFHGRDIFAPVAGHLLNGAPLEQLGPQPDTYKLLELPAPAAGTDEIVAQVIYVDRFGNLVSCIDETLLGGYWQRLEAMRVTCAGHEIGPLVGAYGFVEPGQPLALINSMGYVEVAVNRGSAAEALGAGVGAEVRIRFE